MGTEIIYLTDEDIVLFRTSGTYEISGDVERVKAIIDELNSRNCFRCIIDHRDTDVSWSVMETYDRPAAYEKMGYKRQTKVALVFKQLSGDTAFYENVCRNRGLNMSVFDDYDEAIFWLNSNSS